MPGGVRTEIHLTADDTDGALFLVVDNPPVGWSLPPHRHHNEAETIHIVEGTFEIEVDGERSRLGPGETVHIPRGIVHTGGTAGQQPCRRVVIFSPAGLERFFLEVGTPSQDDDVDLEAALASANRHGWEFTQGG
jgi:quercetin dioxygenase-like cupin family protein